MSIFQVFVHPDARLDARAPHFIEEKFSWGAALVPPVWALVHGLWLETLIWVIGIVALGSLSFLIGDEAVSWLYLLSAVLIGFEAADIRAAALRRKGYDDEGDVIAPSDDVAEMLWLKSGAGR